MTTEEVIKDITKAGEMVQKGLTEGLKALNTNVVDCAKSLRKLAEYPGPEYDCVLVKIRDDPKLLKESKEDHTYDS